MGWTTSTVNDLFDSLASAGISSTVVDGIALGGEVMTFFGGV